MPSNAYYNHTSGQPIHLSRGASSAIRAELDAIDSAFYKVGQDLAAASSAADFKLIYQGSRESDPTQRYNGTQLQNGDLYFNTSSKVMKSFSDGAWYALMTSSAAMLKDGGTFTGPIAGTSAKFTSSVTASGFVGSGEGLTNFTKKQITDALGYDPLSKGGGNMTGQLNGTSAVYSGTITASDFIMNSDERRKSKWQPLPDGVLERFVAVKKIGTYFDKKQKVRKAGAGAQSMAGVAEEFARLLDDQSMGIDYGPAALALLHKTVCRLLSLEKRIAKLEK